jgi:hypothetical protein
LVDNGVGHSANDCLRWPSPGGRATRAPTGGGSTGPDTRSVTRPGTRPGSWTRRTRDQARERTRDREYRTTHRCRRGSHSVGLCLPTPSAPPSRRAMGGAFHAQISGRGDWIRTSDLLNPISSHPRSEGTICAPVRPNTSSRYPQMSGGLSVENVGMTGRNTGWSMIRPNRRFASPSSW